MRIASRISSGPLSPVGERVRVRGSWAKQRRFAEGQNHDGKRIPASKSPSRDSRRRAFSLLEVLLALSLGVVLLTAIGVAVDQAWRLSAQGQTDLQRQQVARAVLRLIERDLRSTMFTPPSEFADEDAGGSTVTSANTGANSTGGNSSTNGSSSGGNSGSTSNSGSTGSTSGSNLSGTGTGGSSTGSSTAGNSTSGSTSTSQPGIVMASRGIWGDQMTLELDGARAQRELAFAAAVNSAAPSMRTSDLRTVMYLIASPGQAADPLGRGGLARREGDRYAIESAELSGKNTASSFSTQLLAPEIVALQFRYFDGLNWQTMWNSQSAGHLPRAIEVQLGFAPPPVKKAGWLADAANQSTQFVRMVLFIPAADPLPEAMQP